MTDRILITGNATCANRGDAAILRGLLHGLTDHHPNKQVIVASRFPDAAEFVLGIQAERDRLYDLHFATGGSLPQKTWRRIVGVARSKSLLENVKSGVASKLIPLSRAHKDFIEWVREFEHVICVGGSFFVDLYGTIQYETLLAAQLAGRKTYLAGHSVGPFQSQKVRAVAKVALQNPTHISLRESVSRSHLEELGISMKHVSIGADTAWLIPDSRPSAIADAELHDITGDYVALTVRSLAPFDKRLGVTQQQYESSLVKRLNQLIEQGFSIVAVSMCTGLGGYAVDDRIVARRIRAAVMRPDRMIVAMHDYNDLEVGHILRNASFLIGTRLHSVILAMRYGTPAVAVYYEHKSEGVLKKLGLDELSVRIDEIDTDATSSLIAELVNENARYRTRIAEAVRKEVAVADSMVRTLLV